MPQPITAVSSSAADFVSYESFLGPRFLEFSSFWYDLSGGIAAGQDGLVVASAKNTLWDGVLLYLLARRAVYQRVGPGPALRSVFAATVDDEALLAELDRLLLQNPGSHEEVASFAQACLDFVDERLGLRHWREFYGSLSTPGLYGRYHQRILGLGKLAEELGVSLPRPVESVMEGMRIRREIERRVAELPVS
jgi:hypothetical protein